MAQGTEEMMKAGASLAQTTNAAAQTALEGMRRLSEVNLQAARASLEQSAEQINALLSAQDVNTLTALVHAMAQPSPEKFTAYAQAVAAIARDTQTDLAQLVREQIERANQQMAAQLEAMARNAPAGSEGAMGFIRQALQAATASYEQFNQNVQRMVQTPAASRGEEAATAPAAAANTAAANPSTGRRGRG